MDRTFVLKTLHSPLICCNILDEHKSYKKEKMINSYKIPINNENGRTKNCKCAFLVAELP